jgi:tRNA threonylcarbamoyladenosine biosynthesis protein TsaB
MKQVSLYIDTTQSLRLALLDEKYQVISYENTSEQKSASIIHQKVHDLFESRGLGLDQLRGILVNNGPGSYTGVRVGEGFAKIFEIDNVKINSFHEHEAIQVIYPEGCWIGNAFKGELFLYSWDKEGVKEKGLFSLDDAIEKISSDVFTNDDLKIGFKINSSKEVIEKNINVLAKRFFEENIRKKPFYYRELEEEFKLSKK